MRMYRKISLILIIIIIAAATSCVYRRSTPRQQSDLPKEDKLAKSDREAVEENINGISIEDDLSITQGSKRNEKDRISGLTKQQSIQMLKSIGSKKMNTVLHEYDTTLPQGINDAVKYNQYNFSYDYFLVTAENGADVRENPVPDATVVARVENLDKMSLLQRVESDEMQGSNIWYRVGFQNGDRTYEGYLHSTEGTPRAFRFNRMQDAVNRLKQQLEEGALHFVSNYKNQNGAPPSMGDVAVDQHGYRVYHSAPAYEQADTGSNFRYVPDGMLVRILGETGEFYHINVPTFNRDYYIPQKYIDRELTLGRLSHVVVVDRDQQNQAAFELVENGLNLISYTLSTTGFKGDFSFETTLGSYKAIEKRERFEYLKKETPDVAGYAPFAVRFTGGAYIHGVPVAYEERDGEKADPGTIEYLHTIGTFPRSSMCVRNYTSHAEFLYNWMAIQNGAVIVIE